MVGQRRNEIRSKASTRPWIASGLLDFHLFNVARLRTHRTVRPRRKQTPMESDLSKIRVTDSADLTITEILRVEHRTLRELMAAMERWLVGQVSPDARRERTAMLEVAVDTHATREEQLLYAALQTRSETARHWVENMEIVHDEVRTLFEQIAQSVDPSSDLWTVLQITEEHFIVEERDVFPMAERLMEHDELVRLGAQ